MAVVIPPQITVGGRPGAEPVLRSQPNITPPADRRRVGPVNSSLPPVSRSPLPPGRIDAAGVAAAQSEQPDAAPRDRGGLAADERRVIERLRRRDTAVRRHEAAHRAAGGRFAAPARFEFARGPDGRRYAIGGEVPIDLSAVPGDPEATIRKMAVVRRAALAPTDASAQDRRIAAQADRVRAQAEAELRATQAQAAFAAAADAFNRAVRIGSGGPANGDLTTRFA